MACGADAIDVIHELTCTGMREGRRIFSDYFVTVNLRQDLVQ